MRFIQAANFTPVHSREIDLLVVHDMEFPELISAAEDVAHFFANQPKGPNGSSAHACFDNNSVVGCVHDHDVAWAAPGANHNGWHGEFAGYAKQTGKQWRDRYDDAMLKIAARVYAHKALRYNIPAVVSDPDELKKGKSGIKTHRYITMSGIGGPSGTHQDPGPAFPLHDFATEVRSIKRYLMTSA
jgi:hypothetical protein